jgi:menaquinone-dependent protoporphyrinogen oxidase
MANILIAYATTEGQAQKVATFVSEIVTDMRHSFELVDCSDTFDNFIADGFEAYFAVGSVHQGHHQKSLVHFVQKHLEDFRSAPSVLLSVSLAAANRDAEHSDEPQKYIDEFIKETGWIPKEYLPVAGALKYVEYDWLKRTIMRSISKSVGGDTDTTKDFEYTDWDALDSFVRAFLAKNLIEESPALQ